MKTDSSTALIIAGLSSVEISASTEALATRDDLLTRARACTKITTAETASQAATMLKELQSFARSIEGTRKDVKAPVLDIGKRIDALADELTASVNKAIEFYRREIGAYDTEQKRIAEEARRKAWEEEERIRRAAEEKERAEAARIETEQRAKKEALEKELAEIKAESERRALEAEAKAQRARTASGEAKALEKAAAIREQEIREWEAAQLRAALDMEADRKRAEAESLKRQEEEAARVVAAHQVANAALERRVEGVTTRRDVEFDVFDVQALYEACPMLVTLEPKKAMIKSALKDLRDGQSLPGIKHWFVSKAH